MTKWMCRCGFKTITGEEGHWMVCLSGPVFLNCNFSTEVIWSGVKDLFGEAEKGGAIHCYVFMLIL